MRGSIRLSGKSFKSKFVGGAVAIAAAFPDPAVAQIEEIIVTATFNF
ncbi:MAG: hypothetical protein HN793_13565 [Rhodospirillaceae bacterium]|jgi:hypothetical protein|nr:hypothetical protein [Rhodospirillaceae bacterium]MBT5239234.1 hypothetical protein [Rhodospirillaceae bacterium]MBT5566162.1 hypothetical protein [Rhodospirillaceae bacterium]MBT6090581.1 hypothetical protein [Rhodospirillaceae bacterium]MBT7451857.1 hypothetical protein [Rhodospirillaceae bacterium]